MTPRTNMPRMERIYQHYRTGKHPRNINEHMDYLMRLASTCRHVTELGSDVGFSTCAFLFAEPEVLVSVDLVRKPDLDGLRADAEAELSTKWEFRLEDSRTVDLDPTELLFIDTGHYYEVIQAELNRHAPKVSRYIAMHDTVGFSERVIAEPSREGIWRAVAEFCRAHPEWLLLQHFENQYGLTVLARIGAVPAAALPKTKRSPKVPKATKPPKSRQSKPAPKTELRPAMPIDA